MTKSNVVFTLIVAAGCGTSPNEVQPSPDGDVADDDAGTDTATDTPDMQAGPTGKFIPSFVVKYGGSASGLQSASDTAKYDLLIVSAGHAMSWKEADHANSWTTLRSYNPDIKIALYALGPTRYNTAAWGEMGLGWEWMKSNHGATTGANRWTGSGLEYPYLTNKLYPNERMMNLGHPGWQDYWWQTIHSDFWGADAEIDTTGADAIFADVTGYDVGYPNGWYDETHPDQAAFSDHPADYYENGAYQHDRHREDMNAFFARAVPGLNAQGISLVPNFSSMNDAEDAAKWAELDDQPNPPFAAMSEAGFVQKYGGTYNTFAWKTKVDTTRALENVRAVIMCHGAPPSGSMDAVVTTGNMGPTTGWEALWYSFTSTLMALNPEKSNAYVGFTVTGYTEYDWFDELDPAFLHFGNAVGEYAQVGSVYIREYDDGWVVVNPTTSAATVTVPSGLGRVLNHANFKNPDAVPLVEEFTLPRHRGVLVLKQDRAADNSDN